VPRVPLVVTVRVFDVVPPAMLKPVAFEVRVKPFTVVAVATPMFGVVMEQEFVRQTFPEPEVE